MTTTDLDIAVIDGRTVLYFDTSRVDATIEMMRAQRVDNIVLTPARGFREKTIGVLLSLPDVRAVSIAGFPDDLDLSPLGELPMLRELNLSGPVKRIDLTRLRNLETFRGYWHKGMSLESLSELRVLSLSHYRSDSHDLFGFPVLPKLVDLEFVQANFRTLNGIGLQKGISFLSLSHLKSLTSLRDVETLESLVHLRCDRCGSIEDHSIVRGIPRLQLLWFNHCGEVASLSFLQKMDALEEFRFVGTNVVDGDMRPLLGLKRVGFLKKKHYSHTPEQVQSLIASAK